MSDIKIVSIEEKPWWKLWTTDNIQVMLENGRGEQKTITIYNRISSESILKDYIAEKYCTGDQFWSLHQRQKKEEKKPKSKKLSDTERVLQGSLRLVGSTFDCAITLSKEAS